MKQRMQLYIDTYGHNRGIWRGAGERARIAAHTDRGAIEFIVSADGSWGVNEGPKLNSAGGYRQIAHGQHSTSRSPSLESLATFAREELGDDPIEVADWQQVAEALYHLAVES